MINLLRKFTKQINKIKIKFPEKKLKLKKQNK